jgi:hypothetical protein
LIENKPNGEKNAEQIGFVGLTCEKGHFLPFEQPVEEPKYLQGFIKKLLQLTNKIYFIFKFTIWI